VYDFSSKKCPHLFDQICGQQTASISIWSNTRLSSSKFISHGCITATNCNSGCQTSQSSAAIYLKYGEIDCMQFAGTFVLFLAVKEL